MSCSGLDSSDPKSLRYGIDVYMRQELMWSTSSQRRTVHPDVAQSLVGQELFTTNWRRVDRQHLEQFHWSVDEDESASDVTANALFPRADENVDGFMLLSLITAGFFNNYPIGSEKLIAWNYGIDELRFPATVYLENRFRMKVTLESILKKQIGWLLSNNVTIELEHSERPAMVAKFLVMLTPVAP